MKIWRMCIVFSLTVYFTILASTFAPGQIKVSTITDGSTASSKAVMIALRSKIRARPKLFTLVGTKDSELGILIMGDCLPQKLKTDAFVCFYTSHYAGGTSKTFMGGGIYEAATSDEVADNFLTSIAQDVVEGWDRAVRANAIESLESCLFLTQSDCKVPHSLESELKLKVINLSQYLQKGALKK